MCPNLQLIFVWHLISYFCLNVWFHRIRNTITERLLVENNLLLLHHFIKLFTL